MQASEEDFVNGGTRNRRQSTPGWEEEYDLPPPPSKKQKFDSACTSTRQYSIAKTIHPKLLLGVEVHYGQDDVEGGQSSSSAQGRTEFPSHSHEQNHIEGFVSSSEGGDESENYKESFEYPRNLKASDYTGIIPSSPWGNVPESSKRQSAASMATYHTAYPEQSSENANHEFRRRHRDSSLPVTPSEVAHPSHRNSVMSMNTFHTALPEQNRGTWGNIRNYQSYAETCSDAASGFIKYGPSSINDYHGLPPGEALSRWSSLRISNGVEEAGAAPQLDSMITPMERVLVRERRVAPRERRTRAARTRREVKKPLPYLPSNGAVHPPESEPAKTSQSAEEDPSKAHVRYWRALPWVIAWLVLFVLCCAVIARNHMAMLAPSLSAKKEDSGDQENKTKRSISGWDDDIWKTFPHEKTFDKVLHWQGNEHFNASITDATVANATTIHGIYTNGTSTNGTRLARRARWTHSRITPVIYRVSTNETWDIDLLFEEMHELGPSQLAMNPKVIVQHKVNLTAVCPSVEQCPAVKQCPPIEQCLPAEPCPPATTTVSALPTCPPVEPCLPSTTTDTIVPARTTGLARPTNTTLTPVAKSLRQIRGPISLSYVENLLTCLWFLPIWLLALLVVRGYDMGWLTPGQSEVKLLITAVVVSTLAAAALALGTEETVTAIVEYRIRN